MKLPVCQQMNQATAGIASVKTYTDAELPELSTKKLAKYSAGNLILFFEIVYAFIIKIIC